MARSESQRVLKIISVIGIIVAVFTLIMSGFMLFGGGRIAGQTTETVVEGMNNSEAGAIVASLGIVMVVLGLIYLIEGILGLRAAKDAQ